MAASLKWLPGPIYHALVQETTRGPMIPQQVLLSANSLFIIIGVVGMAWLTRRLRTLEAMFFGMVMATIGVLGDPQTGCLDEFALHPSSSGQNRPI